MKKNSFKITCAIATMAVCLVLGCVFGPRVDAYVAQQKAEQPVVAEQADEVKQAVVTNRR